MPALTALIAISYLLLGVIFLSLASILYIAIKKIKELDKLQGSFDEKEEQLKRRLYQVSVLEKLTEKLGYSLDVKKVIDATVESLHEIVSYSAVSYVLIEGDSLLLKIDLVEDVSRNFVNTVRENLLNSVKELTAIDAKNMKVDESVSGHLVDGSDSAKVLSTFDIPLTVSSEVVGVMSISSVNQDQFEKTEIDLIHDVIGRATGAVTKLQQVISREKGKLESMMNSMVDGIFMVDEDFKILVINPSCRDMLGIREGKETNIFDLVGAFGKAVSFDEVLAKVFETGKSQRIEEVKLGNKYAQISVIPVEIQEDKKGIGIIIHDRSEELRLVHLREDFTAMMIHELRSPLTVMKSTADLLLKEGSKIKKVARVGLFEQVKKSSERLLGIVNSLLDVSKMESGKFEIEKTVGDLNELLKEEAEEYSTLAKEKGVKFILKLDEKLGAFAFDPAKITQVVNNLLSNALKHTNEGNIAISSQIRGTEIVVGVSDTGEGIPDDFKSRLFNKFSQVGRSLSASESSTGLGLVISKGIITAHGGRIWVEDNVPRGSKFVFSLPLS